LLFIIFGIPWWQPIAHHQAKATEGALAAPSGVVLSHMKVGDLRGGEKLGKKPKVVMMMIQDEYEYDGDDDGE
jgi:hypothetical protein